MEVTRSLHAIVPNTEMESEVKLAESHRGSRYNPTYVSGVVWGNVVEIEYRRAYSR